MDTASNATGGAVVGDESESVTDEGDAPQTTAMGDEDDVDVDDKEKKGDTKPIKRRTRGIFTGPAPENWTDEEIAQFKKALIVIGAKSWKDMTEYLPRKSASDLRYMYKYMGGSWGDNLKPFIREHRYLTKLGKLKERDIWLTPAELQTVREGGAVAFRLERPDKPGPFPKEAKDGNNKDDDEDLDSGDEDEEKAAKRGSGVKKTRKPISDTLKSLPEDVASDFKRKRVDEILEHCVKGTFIHKSDAVLNKLRAFQPVGPKPTEPVYSPVLVAPVRSQTKLSNLVSSKLLPAEPGSGKQCLSFEWGSAPIWALCDATVDAIRAPIFMKNSTSGVQKGVPAAKTVPIPAVGTAAAAPVAVQKPTAPVPPTLAAVVAATPKRGVMKPGLARTTTPKTSTTPTSGAPAAAGGDATGLDKQGPKKKAKTDDFVPANDENPEATTLAQMPTYFLHNVDPDSQTSQWLYFKKALALEQHVGGIVRRATTPDASASGDGVGSVVRVSRLCAAAVGEASQILDGTCLPGGSVLRTLRIGDVQEGGYYPIFIVTHWLAAAAAAAAGGGGSAAVASAAAALDGTTVVEAIARTNITRIKGGDPYAAALHPQGHLAAVATGATITVFDLSGAAPTRGQSGSAKVVSIHSEGTASIMYLKFSPHPAATALLCSFDGEALRIWKAWGAENARKFITAFSVNAAAAAPYMVSTNLLQSLRDPLQENSGMHGKISYQLAWHPHGDLFVTYSETVARVWRFLRSQPTACREPIFEHLALEGILSVAFSPKPGTRILVVLSRHQKIRFIDLDKNPDDFSLQVVTALPVAQLTGFVFHPGVPDLLYGITPDGTTRLSAFVLDPRHEGGAYRASWALPEVSTDGIAPSLALQSGGHLLPRERCMLCVDPDGSILCWFDAARTYVSVVSLQPVAPRK